MSRDLDLADLVEQLRRDRVAQQAEIDELRACQGSLDARVLALHMAEWIVQQPSGVDHAACGRCLPDGESVIPGFMCARHVAIGLMAAAGKCVDSFVPPVATTDQVMCACGGFRAGNWVLLALAALDQAGVTPRELSDAYRLADVRRGGDDWPDVCSSLDCEIAT